MLWMTNILLLSVCCTKTLLNLPSTLQMLSLHIVKLISIEPRPLLISTRKLVLPIMLEIIINISSFPTGLRRWSSCIHRKAFFHLPKGQCLPGILHFFLLEGASLMENISRCNIQPKFSFFSMCVCVCVCVCLCMYIFS